MNDVKFYYCESLDKYLIGQRCDNFYYAEIILLEFLDSRYRTVPQKPIEF